MVETPTPRDPEPSLHHKPFEAYLSRIGQQRRPFTDVYAFLLRARWITVVLLTAAVYLAVNLAFALLYFAVPGSIAHCDGSLLEAFFFSVQTFGSIGYGHMYSQGLWGNAIVVVESFVSLLALAVLTGIVFAKFSRPHARVLFSSRMVVEMRNGVPTLSLRVANERANDVVQASLRISMLKTTYTEEGQRMRRFYDLSLERSSTPIFVLSWQLFHPIVETSPLYGMNAQDLIDGDVRFIVALTGLDGTFGQTIHARHAYWSDEVLFDHRFVDVIENLPGGHVRMDYRKFHRVRPESSSSKNDVPELTRTSGRS